MVRTLHKTRYGNIFKVAVDGKIRPEHFEVRVSTRKSLVTGKPGKKSEQFYGSLNDALVRQMEMKRLYSNATTSGAAWTMNELVTAYFDHKQDKKEVTTTKTDLNRWDIMAPFFGTRKARSVTTLDIDVFLNDLKRSRDVTNSTVDRYRSLLSAIFKVGLQWQVVTFNPVTGSSQFPAEHVERTPVNVNHYYSVLDFFRQNGDANNSDLIADLMELSLRFASRRSEILGLRVGDFDPEQKTITICRGVKEPKGGGYVISGTKAKNKRTFEVEDDEIALIKRLEWRLLSQLRKMPDPSAYLFSANGGTDPILPNNLTHRIERVKENCCGECGRVYLQRGVKRLAKCEDCNVDLGVDIVLKYARRLTTTTLLRAGVNPAYVQYRGGWIDSKTMWANYADFHTEDAVAAHKAMSTLRRVQ